MGRDRFDQNKSVKEIKITGNDFFSFVPKTGTAKIKLKSFFCCCLTKKRFNPSFSTAVVSFLVAAAVVVVAVVVVAAVVC